MEHFGDKIDPFREIREPNSIKGYRRLICIEQSTETASAGSTFNLDFPKLTGNDLLIPGTALLMFRIELKSDSDNNRTLYDNVSRNIVKQMRVSVNSNEIFNLDDYNIYNNYKDNWIALKHKDNSNCFGIEKENITKLRIGAGDASNVDKLDVAIANVHGNGYAIPLDIALLNDHHPFYPSGLDGKLSFAITWNDHSKVVKSTDVAATYKITHLKLQYEVLNEPNLADKIKSRYRRGISFYFDRVHRQYEKTINKSDNAWTINLNTNVKSLRGIFLIFKDVSDVNPNNSYNPDLLKVKVQVEGMPEALYVPEFRRDQHFGEICKYFVDDFKNYQPSAIFKYMQMDPISLGKYLTDRYALWLDFRSSDDNASHGSGRKIGSHGGGIQIELTSGDDSEGQLKCFVYLVMDAQLQIKDGRFYSLQY